MSEEYFPATITCHDCGLVIHFGTGFDGLPNSLAERHGLFFEEGVVGYYACCRMEEEVVSPTSTVFHACRGRRD